MTNLALGVKPISMEVDLTPNGNFLTTIRRQTGDWDDGTTLAIVFDEDTSWPATIVDDTATWNVPAATVAAMIEANPSEAQLVITVADTPVVRGAGQINIGRSASASGLVLGGGAEVVIDGTDQIIAVPVPGLPGAKGDKGDKGDPGTTDYDNLVNKPALVAVATSGSAADLTSGVLDPARLPALAITSVTVVESQAEMLALDVQQGDVAIRSDFTPNKAYILAGTPATTLANWKDITASDLVQSVAGLNGNITAAGLAGSLQDSIAALVSAGGSLDTAFAAKIAAALAAGDFATATALASLAGALTSETSDRAAADLVNANAIAAIVLANHFTPKGTWTAQTYSALDVVYRNGSSYVATTAALSTDVPGVAALWVPYAIGLDANSAADTFATFDLVGRVKPTRVITDSTTRADSATTSGSAETGQAWTPANTGLWGITGNKMYLVSNGTGIRANLVSGGASLLTWSADITLASGGEGGLVIAAVDSANMFTVALSAATGNLLIYSINAGATSTRLTQAAGIAAGTYNLMASISGDSTAATLSIWLNRVLIKEFAISSTDRTAFLAATKYGAYLASSAQANRVTNIKADSPVTATDRKLIEWDAEEAWAVTAATIDTDGFPSTATVRWPDGTVGTFTLTAKYTGPGVTAINSYTVTYPARGKTLTQAAPTRDPVTSAVLSVPKATVA